MGVQFMKDIDKWVTNLYQIQKSFENVKVEVHLSDNIKGEYMKAKESGTGMFI